MLVRIEIQTVAQPFPPDTVAGDWKFAIYDVENNLIEERRSQSPSADFDLPVGENYRADGSRLRANGTTLGAIKSVTFDVVDTTPVVIAVAGDISATQLAL